jgi:uncharacterized LabA/DUF88 family protein
MGKPLYAIMLDGGFVTKKLYVRLKRPPNADDIVDYCETLRSLPYVGADYELLRIYFYDAPPSAETVQTPVSQTRYDLSKTQRFRWSQSLFDQLVLRPHFALRMGETRLRPQHWRVKPKAVNEIIAMVRPMTDRDFDLDIEQKGVDLRIGLDMARLALRDTVRSIIVVTGDSDFVPAFKFARREGVKVILVTMGHNVRKELRAHADIVVN